MASARENRKKKKKEKQAAGHDSCPLALWQLRAFVQRADWTSDFWCVGVGVGVLRVWACRCLCGSVGVRARGRGGREGGEVPG